MGYLEKKYYRFTKRNILKKIEEQRDKIIEIETELRKREHTCELFSEILFEDKTTVIDQKQFFNKLLNSSYLKFPRDERLMLEMEIKSLYRDLNMIFESEMDSMLEHKKIREIIQKYIEITNSYNKDNNDNEGEEAKQIA